MGRGRERLGAARPAAPQRPPTRDEPRVRGRGGSPAGGGPGRGARGRAACARGAEADPAPLPALCTISRRARNGAAPRRVSVSRPRRSRRRPPRPARRGHERGQVDGRRAHRGRAKARQLPVRSDGLDPLDRGGPAALECQEPGLRGHPIGIQRGARSLGMPAIRRRQRRSSYPPPECCPGDEWRNQRREVGRELHGASPVRTDGRREIALRDADAGPTHSAYDSNWGSVYAARIRLASAMSASASSPRRSSEGSPDRRGTRRC